MRVSSQELRSDRSKMATHIGKSAQTNDISRPTARRRRSRRTRRSAADGGLRRRREPWPDRGVGVAAKHAQVEKEEDEFDDDGFFDDDATVRTPSRSGSRR